MMRAGIDAEQLDVHHMRKKRQGLPVGERNRREDLHDPLPGQSRPDGRIVQNVDSIVKRNEIVLPRAPEAEQRGCDQQSGYRE